MSSIMTNASAMTALKTLNATNKSLSVTQSRISTGYRVAESSDNAAYWSIATTMRSDNKALSTVQDALGLGVAKIDTTYTGMNSAIGVVDEIKSKLVAAREPGVDKSKIQAEITQLQSQLTSIASASAFSGENWLSVDSSSASYNATKSIVSSFTRSASGAVSVGTIGVDVSKVALFDASATGDGLLDGGTVTSPLANVGGLIEGFWPISTDPLLTEPFALGANETINFDLALSGGPARAITIDKALIDTTLSRSDGAVPDASSVKQVLDAAITNAGFVSGFDYDIELLGNYLHLSPDSLSGSVAVSNMTMTTTGGAGITSINIANATNTDIDTHISSIDAMLGKMTSAAADLGAAKKRIELQSAFVSNLRDTIDRGVGTLVDADMNKESTRLQALQVQQQLGIQALSIANGNSQSILSLFRG